MSRGSASAATMEAEPPDMRYQAEPGNEYNHLGLLYTSRIPKYHKINQLSQVINYVQNLSTC